MNKRMLTNVVYTLKSENSIVSITVLTVKRKIINNVIVSSFIILLTTERI